MQLGKILIASVISIVTVTNAVAEPTALSRQPNALKAYHDSGEYMLEFTGVIKRAHSYLAQRIAEREAHRLRSKPLALVLDIDETSLSNYPFMASHQFAGGATEFNKYLAKAHYLPLVPTLRLFHFAQQHGVAVFFVTGRREHLHDPTVTSLQMAGYQHWDGLFFKPENYNLNSVIPFKAKVRQRIEGLGYDVVASIGDQKSDIDGGYADMGFKLPNPYYYLP